MGSVNQMVCVHRTQFPVCSAYAITIHKSQGMTLNRAYVDCGNQTFASGMIYVAMSRVKQLKGLTLLNLAPDKIKADSKTIKEYNRLHCTIGMKPLKNVPTFENFTYIRKIALLVNDNRSSIWDLFAAHICQ